MYMGGAGRLSDRISGIQRHPEPLNMSRLEDLDVLILASLNPNVMLPSPEVRAFSQALDSHLKMADSVSTSGCIVSNVSACGENSESWWLCSDPYATDRPGVRHSGDPVRLPVQYRITGNPTVHDLAICRAGKPTQCNLSVHENT